jgi:hypothetical protein
MELEIAEEQDGGYQRRDTEQYKNAELRFLGH